MNAAPENVFEDDDMRESDMEDEDQPHQVIPTSFVDYLYLRYSPLVGAAFNRNRRVIDNSVSLLRRSGSRARSIAWSVSTSAIVYLLPIFITVFRQMSKKEALGQGSGDASFKADAGTTTAPPVKEPDMLPPPSVV
ncbi:hypothetical protein AAMO2058_001094100 [Amorphochlora amoebiformis]|uniref:Mitochondrial import receptor subunit tom22 n=1 Tax=Amorphochlora amoebiformis TaxID=1561963 RepID=A0A7S0D351_9EUKA|mmetsp:Transcript_18527/g.29541  ORF Transcript_18527/g.29541 Transcript_18527/m.29541 type:complete len:136 (+) Transcript_18527:81-488(+)|eukprot:1103868-Amorphochlora_amoeboformis.AAC.1